MQVIGPTHIAAACLNSLAFLTELAHAETNLAAGPHQSDRAIRKILYGRFLGQSALSNGGSRSWQSELCAPFVDVLRLR